MKINKVLVYLLIALPALLMQSCLKDQKDIFDEPSATRIQNVLNETQRVLTSSEYGWALNYYYDREDPTSAVYTLKFIDNNNVEARTLEFSSDGITADDTFTSLYKLTTDDGPVLSFDTYNEILHFFATPSAQYYQAYDGDFEFVILGISDDQNTITLKGKRNGNTATLTRLAQPADQYLAATTDVRDALSGFAVLQATVGDNQRLKFAYSDYVYTIIYKDADGNSVTETQPFHVTDQGAVFYQPIEAYDRTITGLNYNAATDEITLADDASVVLAPSTAAIDQLVYGLWYLEYDNSSDAVKAAWDVADANASVKQYGGLSFAMFGNYNGNGFGYYGVIGNRYLAGEFLDFEEVDDNTITIKTTGNLYANGSYFSITTATAPFNGTFKLGKDDDAAPTYISLTDVDDPTSVTVLTAE